MNRPLFIHPNSSFLDRLTKESHAFALVTTSMVQALQWITHPEVPISAVFLCPDDISFSAFRFLEITLTHRPALPVFLFENANGYNPENAQKLMKSTHIKGVFFGTESYSVLVDRLTVQMDSTQGTRLAVPDQVQQAGYVAFPISDFFTGSHYPYHIFLLSPTGRMNLFAEKDSPIDPAYLSNAAKQTQFLYVKEEEIKKCKQDIKTTQSQFLDDPSFSNTWKTAEMMVSAKSVLDEMKQSGVNDQLIDYAQVMLNDLFKLLARIETDEGLLSHMIERAQKCDRAVFCASWAMLICRQMKFEKTATLEILGLASVLQDLSLYRTAFGDISDRLPRDLTTEEMKYYHQHPITSADLIANHTDVPQVTLQVVRQHHERRDKSGFPNHVGGSQLHPMSEILSLINSYYETTKTYSDDSQMIQELTKNIFPHYSQNIVMAFKQVLGNLIKDKLHAASQSTADVQHTSGKKLK